MKVKMRTYVLTVVGLLCIFAITLLSMYHVENKQEKEKVEVQPLVIETDSGILPGTYNGIIVFSGEGIVDRRYEGAMNITIDGDMLLVTCSDDVREEYIREE